MVRSLGGLTPQLYGSVGMKFKATGLPTCSTHLLCYRDTAARDKTYVAVKILTAHATACIVGGLSHEYDVFRRIESANRSHPGFPHCLALRHCFTAYSSVGGHICFVTDVLGSNLQSLRVAQPNQTFSLNVAKRIVKQILLGLDYLHRECGYVHTG
jgi:serine/threonine-protein kinase SRPK3